MPKLKLALAAVVPTWMPVVSALVMLVVPVTVNEPPRVEPATPPSWMPSLFEPVEVMLLRLTLSVPPWSMSIALPTPLMPTSDTLSVPTVPAERAAAV